MIATRASRARLLCGICLVTIGVPVRAQSVATGDTATSAAVNDDIIVTAQKRTQRLIDVPTSVSVVQGDKLEEIGARSLTDYASYLPGFAVNSGGSPGWTSITLRGITTGSSASTLVPVFLDDTPVSPSGGFIRAGQFTLDLLPYDLDRVEVLRGPQGTLYGAGSMGGMLKYVLKDANPREVDGQVGGGLESIQGSGRPSYIAQGAVNLPIVSDTLAIRASVGYRNNAGFIDNLANGQTNTNSSTQKSGRFAIYWQPAPNFKVRATALLQNNDVDGFDHVQAVRSSSGQVSFNGYTDRHGLPDTQTIKNRLYSITGDWDVGFATLKSTAGWEKTLENQFWDLTTTYGSFISAATGGAVRSGYAPFLLDINFTKFTEETRLTSSGNGNFQWMIGAFYTKENAKQYQYIKAYDLNLNLINNTNVATIYSPNDYQEIAGFGNATYKFSDHLEITGGLRYARNKQNYQSITSGTLVGTTNSLGRSNEGVVTWMVSPQWHVTPDAMLYARVATGYRAGGPNGVAIGATATIPTSYAADRLINYEAGFKGSLLDHRLTVDVSAFYIDWSDIQLTIRTPLGVTYPGNGGGATSRGFEASLAYRLLGGLTLGGNVSYTDAHLTDDAPTISGKAGDRLPFASKWTATATADYTTKLTDRVSLIAGAAFRYRGSYNSTVTSAPTRIVLPAQKITDANIGLRFEGTTVSLYSKNLFNQHILSGVVNYYATAPVLTVLPPRTVGISLNQRF